MCVSECNFFSLLCSGLGFVQLKSPWLCSSLPKFCFLKPETLVPFLQGNRARLENQVRVVGEFRGRDVRAFVTDAFCSVHRTHTKGRHSLANNHETRKRRERASSCTNQCLAPACTAQATREETMMESNGDLGKGVGVRVWLEEWGFGDGGESQGGVGRVVGFEEQT